MTEQFCTPKEFAERLSVSMTTARDILRRKEIPSYKIGGSRRIAEKDIESFLAQRREER